MSAHTPTHACSDADCCYRGQPSPTACRCHKPAAQMMREQIEALVEALEECRTSYCGYAITKADQYPDALASFWKEIRRIDGIARAALALVGGAR